VGQSDGPILLGAGHTSVEDGVQAVTLTGKLRGCVLTAWGTEGVPVPGLKVTFMTWPSFAAGPQPAALAGLVSVGGDVQTMWRSAKYSVPSGAKAKPSGL
jgi:hypothetical protein